MEAIAENPYMQYFIGLGEFSAKLPFDSALIEKYSQSISQDILDEIFKMI